MARYAIACGHDVTADAAEGALRAGGTAVDAVISAALAAMVAEPVLAGLLGGGFLVVREPNGQSRVLDFFVQTPLQKRSAGELDFRAIHADFGTTTQEFHVGAGAIATPGVVPGLAEAHERFGRVPMRVLAEPAVTAARGGVEITEYQARLGKIVAAILGTSPESRALFCDDGEPLKAGAIYRNAQFADVLEVFAAEGPRFVTEGEVAGALLELAAEGGHLDRADLAAYAPEWRTPLRVQRGSARIAMNPPPSLGGMLIAFGLQVLPDNPDPIVLIHGLEATARARIEAASADLLNPDLLARYRREVARTLSTRGTTHISVIDRDGMGAALTLSNGEGCGLIAPGTGIMPNNMLGEADLMPDGFEHWAPGQRLASMMCPMAVEWPDGRFAMLGSGGSNRIRTALVQVILEMIDNGLSLEEAITAQRAHVEIAGPDTADDPDRPEQDRVVVDFEDVTTDAVREAILATWPEATPWPDRSMFFGGVHAAMRNAREDTDAAGDPRRAGVSRVG